MTLAKDLPDAVVSLLEAASISEYVTISGEGMPIDTPVLYFPGEGLQSFDIATGLSYPAKADRARRNPKVGLWVEGRPEEPVVALAGMAAVRDADLQANVDRYISEAGYTLAENPEWSLASKAVWYWTRIFIEIVPVRLYWWDNQAALDGPPHVWRAPEGTVYGQSDPAPQGQTSKRAKWAELPWQDLARQALGRNVRGHLSIVDAEGFPVPVGARTVEVTDSGFRLDMPRGLPGGYSGKACLTFSGIETFLGEVREYAGSVDFTVQRTLPLFPMTHEKNQLWEPTDHTRAELMRRLETELARRGQGLPNVPDVRPEPTPGYQRRLARMGRSWK